jgi:hypothetical protein
MSGVGNLHGRSPYHKKHMKDGTRWKKGMNVKKERRHTKQVRPTLTLPPLSWGTYYTNRLQLCGVVIILILARTVRWPAGIIRFHIDRHDGGAPGEDQ